VTTEAEEIKLTYSGAAIWTAVIAKTSFVESVKVQGGTSLGIQVNAGGTLCESSSSLLILILPFPHVLLSLPGRSWRGRWLLLLGMTRKNRKEDAENRMDKTSANNRLDLGIIRFNDPRRHSLRYCLLYLQVQVGLRMTTTLTQREYIPSIPDAMLLFRS
jgi:hypothetical protein